MKSNKKTTAAFVAEATAAHGTRYDYSEAFYEGYHSKVKIICHVDGAFYQTPASHLYGRGCPKCGERQRVETKAVSRQKNGNNLAKLFPELMKEWDYNKNAVDPSKLGPKSAKKVSWICPLGHSYDAIISHRTSGTGCSICGGQTSKIEILVFSFLKSIFPSTVWREKIDGKELDCYIPEIAVGVEVDGYPWHQNSLKRDSLKTRFFKKRGIKIFRFRDFRNPELSDETVKFNFDYSLEKPALELLQVIKGDRAFHPSSKQKKQQKCIFDKMLATYPGAPEERSLLAVFPDIKTYWSKDNNREPATVWTGSNENFLLICADCNNDFKRTAKHLTKHLSARCNKCSKQHYGRLKAFAAAQRGKTVLSGYPELAKEWSKENAQGPDDFSFGSNKIVAWVCKKHGNYEMAIKHRTQKGSICPKCSYEIRGKQKQKIIYLINEKSGEKLVFDSASKAAKFLSVSSAYISTAKKRGTAIKGYKLSD